MVLPAPHLHADPTTETRQTVMSSLAAVGIKGTEEDAPESFFCPVTGERMRDPVSTQDGHTYERTAIEEWFRAGHITSPNTNSPLPDTRLTPNIALKNAIEEWEEKYLLKIRRDALHLERQIGSGSFKSVYRGTYRFRVRERQDPVQKDVAILKMRSGSLDTEAKMFLRLGRHPRLVRFYGQCKDGDDQLLVTEFAPRGSLSDAFNEMHDEETIGDVSVEHQMVMIRQICQGMEMLASQQVIHRDLAARNVLLFHFDPGDAVATSVKVSDFGLSVGAYGRSHAYVRGVEVPIRYLAPEAIERGRFSEKTDVWAFGVTMWEILTYGKIPYFEIPRDEDVITHVLGVERLQRPGGCPRLLWSIVERCWAASPKARPTFAQLSAMLGGPGVAQEVPLLHCAACNAVIGSTAHVLKMGHVAGQYGAATVYDNRSSSMGVTVSGTPTKRQFTSGAYMVHETVSCKACGTDLHGWAYVEALEEKVSTDFGRDHASQLADNRSKVGSVLIPDASLVVSSDR